MPVGVPFIEYIESESEDESEDDEGEESDEDLVEEPEWINLYHALYRERMLFLCQELDTTVANELIGLMLYLNEDDPSRPLFMYINSPGGSVTCGIGVYDIMRCVNSGITTICMGGAASMASFILTGGTYGRRLAFPHCRIMIHQPEGGSDGQATEVVFEAEEVARIRRSVGRIYANRTNQSVERIAADLDRDVFMSAKQAQMYGIVDFVAMPVKEVTDPQFWDRLTYNPIPMPYNTYLPNFIEAWKASLTPEFAVEPGGRPKSRLASKLPVVFPDREAEETGITFPKYGKSLIPEGTYIPDRVFEAYPTPIGGGVTDTFPIISLERYKSIDIYGFKRAKPSRDGAIQARYFVGRAIEPFPENTAILKDQLQVQLNETFSPPAPNEEGIFQTNQTQPIKIRPLPIPTTDLATKIRRLSPISTTTSITPEDFPQD